MAKSAEALAIETRSVRALCVVAVDVVDTLDPLTDVCVGHCMEGIDKIRSLSVRGTYVTT